MRAQYDVLLTEALLRLAYHLSFGKVDPETFDAQWNYGRTLASMNVAQEVEQALAAEDVYQRVEALKPTHPLYVELKRELVRFRAATASDDRPFRRTIAQTWNERRASSVGSETLDRLRRSERRGRERLPGI